MSTPQNRIRLKGGKDEFATLQSVWNLVLELRTYSEQKPGGITEWQARLLTVVACRYKVTKGLLDRFGEKRVIDSPITESGFCGLTVGAALAGLHPVVSNALIERESYGRG